MTQIIGQKVYGFVWYLHTIKMLKDYEGQFVWTRQKQKAKQFTVEQIQQIVNVMFPQLERWGRSDNYFVEELVGG